MELVGWSWLVGAGWLEWWNYTFNEHLVREGKRGAIELSLPPILERLALDRDAWLMLITQFEQQFGHWVGSERIVRQIYSDKRYQRIPSISNLLQQYANSLSLLAIVADEDFVRQKYAD